MLLVGKQSTVELSLANGMLSPFRSRSQLYELRFGWLLKHITQLVEAGIAHVKDCPLCKAKGFICELCDKDADIIFPFELHKVAKVCLLSPGR